MFNTAIKALSFTILGNLSIMQIVYSNITNIKTLESEEKVTVSLETGNKFDITWKRRISKKKNRISFY